MEIRGYKRELRAVIMSSLKPCQDYLCFANGFAHSPVLLCELCDSAVSYSVSAGSCFS